MTGSIALEAKYISKNYIPTTKSSKLKRISKNKTQKTHTSFLMWVAFVILFQADGEDRNPPLRH